MADKPSNPKSLGVLGETAQTQTLRALLEWAKDEREDWADRNADRYWQMNRVVGRIESALASPPSGNTKVQNQEHESSASPPSREGQDGWVHVADIVYNHKTETIEYRKLPCAPSPSEETKP